MKNLLLKLFVIASCITFSVQSMNASATVVTSSSTTSLAASLMAAEKRSGISDEELFGAKVSYSTDLSQSQANGAVGEAWWVPPALIVTYLVSCVKVKHKEIYANQCTDNAGVRTCSMVLVGLEKEYGMDCPF
jgi:hypothetical protein